MYSVIYTSRRDADEERVTLSLPSALSFSCTCGGRERTTAETGGENSFISAEFYRTKLQTFEPTGGSDLSLPVHTNVVVVESHLLNAHWSTGKVRTCSTWPRRLEHFLSVTKRRSQRIRCRQTSPSKSILHPPPVMYL